MKHLTKQEAIGRMMLAYTTLIEEKFHCELVWFRSIEQLELYIKIYECDERPQLPILQHPDFESKETEVDDDCYCIQYLWSSETEAQ